MDKEFIPAILAVATDPKRLKQAQKDAAAVLPEYPHNGCAVTLCAILRMAGVKIKMEAGAGRLATLLGSPLIKPEYHNWTHVHVGEQQPGDVGVAFDLGGNPGADHIY